MNLYKITGWDETTLQEAPNGLKFAKAEITQEYQGSLQGTGKLVYLLTYKTDGSASYVGTEWFTGQINGKTGSCVFAHSGVFRDQIATGQFNLIQYSATADLIGLQGQGAFSAGHGQEVEYSFDYAFA